MKKRIIVLLLLITITFGLTACEDTYLNSSNPSEQFRVNYERIGDSEIISYYNQADDYGKKVDPSIVQHINELGFDLLQSSDEDATILSPVGTYLSLALLYSGVSGEAQNEFDDILEFNKVRQLDINTNIHDLLFSLYRNDANSNITYANSVYVPKSIRGSEAFLEATSNYLFSRLTKIDFINQTDAVDEINQWISNYTDKRIRSIIETVDSDTKSLALNGFHYEAIPTTEFAVVDYFPDDFYGKEETTTVDYMRTIGKFGFYEDDEVQVLDVSLGRGTTSIVFIIPKNMSSKEYLDSISSDEVDQLLALTKTKEMEITIPQMTLEHTNDMNTLLTNLGVTSIFMKPGNMNGLSEDTTITHYIHKVGLTLDKNKTNISKIDVLNEMVKEPIMEYEEFQVNRPFLFVIKDHTLNANIMMGTMDYMGYEFDASKYEDIDN